MVSQENKKQQRMVMLVDDSSIDNFVNKKIIARYEFASDIIDFTRPKEALSYLAELNNDESQIVPSILFLDLDMPVISGMEFLDAFDLLSEKIRRKMDIVILTSSINPADVEICNTHNSVLTFLHKPLVKHNLDELEQILLKKNSKLVKY